MLDDILTKALVTQLVENLVHTEKMTYMEAVLHICNDRLIDPLDIGKLIGPTIKSKIEVEAMAANLLPNRNRLANFI